jgi:hypothetical protein
MQAAGGCARVLLEVESIGQLLPAAVKVLIKRALLRFFGWEKWGGGNQFVIQLRGQDEGKTGSFACDFEYCNGGGRSHRGVRPEHHEPRVEENGQPNVNNSAKRRVAGKSRLTKRCEGGCRRKFNEKSLQSGG